jgi:DNA-binding transcriptional ArsR family regulator
MHFDSSLYRVHSPFFSTTINCDDLTQLGSKVNLETLIASSCRRRILKVLAERGQTNVIDLVRKVNSTYNQVNSNLQILEKEGIIIDEHIGRMRIVRLAKENPKTALLLQALKILQTTID